MKRTMRTRALPILLTMFMLLALVPATAWAADIQAGTPTITPNISTDSGTVVGFAGQEWWVIGDASSGVYRQADSVTLLHKGTGSYPEAYGTVVFRTGAENFFTDSTQYSGDNWYYANNPSGTVAWSTPNEYRGSMLQQKMEEIAGTFPQKEQDLINARTLTASDDTNYQISGGDVANQKLWALSYDEANTINNNTVRSYGYWWWLRSPASNASAYLALPKDSPSPLPVTSTTYAVRPAFNLNLSSVIFTSATGGGKSDAVGSLSAATAPTGAIKFTFADASISKPTLTLAGTTNGTDTVNFGYTGATTGTNYYVSCVLEQSGVVTHYGKLANCTSATNGIFSIPISGLTAGTYDLKVFCEQANGDNYSDFAGTSVDMTLTVGVDGKGTIGGSGYSTDSTAPTLSNVNFVERTSDTAGKITVTSGEAGTVYYKAVADGAGVTQPTVAGDLSSWTSVGAITASTATQYSVSLAAGAQDVYVVAVDAAGNISTQSNVDFAAYVAPVVPDAPTAVTSVAGDGQATVSFTPPASDGGRPITTYIVTATPIGGGTPISFTFTTNILTFIGLTNGVTYTFSVVATNTVGLGAASAASDPVTPKYATPFSVTKHFDDFTGSGTSFARVDAEHTNFLRILKDGKEIDPIHYAITQGSTIVTFTEAYLKTLANGTHRYVAEFSDGTSDNIRLNVNVAAVAAPTTSKQNAGTPATGDNRSVAFLWTALVCAALCGIMCLIIWRKRQRDVTSK